MSFSIDFFFRIIGAIALTIAGGVLGNQLSLLLDGPTEAYVAILGLVGFLTGLILTPYFTIRPLRMIRYSLISMPPQQLVAILVGIFLGLIASVLFSIPLSLLPTPFKQIMPIALALIFCYLGAVVIVMRQNDLFGFLGSFSWASKSNTRNNHETAAQVVLLDTSAIIDGRITDISKTGFVRATLLVPNFILLELQHIADSADPIRRNRGRRGLEILNMLQKDSPIPVQITDMDVSEAREADTKLVALARKLGHPIMTNDYNLNRVAELQGVLVLNINDLANAVKSAFLPGEHLHIKVIQEGTEPGQGVGYLEDGTMVVIENGQNHLSKKVDATVTKVLQTSAGRMIFARI